MPAATAPPATEAATRATGWPAFCIRPRWPHPRSFKHVKQSEELQMLRNYAAVIDEIEGVASFGLQRRLQWRQGPAQRQFVHVLEPRQAGGYRKHALQADAKRKLQLERPSRAAGAARGVHKAAHKAGSHEARLQQLQEEIMGDVQDRMQQLQRLVATQHQHQQQLAGDTRYEVQQLMKEMRQVMQQMGEFKAAVK